MSQHREGADVTAAPNSRAGSIAAPQQNTHMLGTHPLTDRLAEAPPQLELLVYSKPSPSTGVSYATPKGHSLFVTAWPSDVPRPALQRGSVHIEVDSNWKPERRLQLLVDTNGCALSLGIWLDGVGGRFT